MMFSRGADMLYWGSVGGDRSEPLFKEIVDVKVITCL